MWALRWPWREPWTPPALPELCLKPALTELDHNKRLDFPPTLPQPSRFSTDASGSVQLPSLPHPVQTLCSFSLLQCPKRQHE
ncbi:hypothetical protein P7K49_023309 [Saguinus oedipus]|uniref:Uncharacterized protein n=1 Tax=Saguinus oedipus TaxID=9490 RepID=A0ABQ9ULD5_SAGOE|nr:hypothetical protein P7K49_023309 [Saguinus oedipus]